MDLECNLMLKSWNSMLAGWLFDMIRDDESDRNPNLDRVESMAVSSLDSIN